MILPFVTWPEQEASAQKESDRGKKAATRRTE